MLTLAAWPRPHHTVSETWQARHLEFDLLVKIVCCTIYHDISGLYSWLFLVEVIESLSNNESDGYENVTQKVNSRFLKLYRACSISFIRQMLVNFLELNSKGLYQSSRNEKGKLLSCVLVLDKTWNYALSRRSRATNSKKCTKSVHVQTCCFAYLNFLGFFFLPFSLQSPASLLKLHNV